MQYSKFAIDEDPFCVWDKNLHQHNVHFLDSIDPDFFEHVVKTYTETLDTKERHAAQALRLFHGHSLETLLAFLFATIQAPDCVFGWLRKYEPSHLRNLIAKVNAGKPILSKLNLGSISWESISEVIHCCLSLDDKEKEAAIKKSFASFWKFSADQYIQELNSFEYNSIKHGLRARSGGFQLRVGSEHEYGVPPPSGEMVTVKGGKRRGGKGVRSFFLHQKLFSSSLVHAPIINS